MPLNSTFEMLDATSLWRTAKQAVGNTVEKVQTNLSQALADLDGDTEGLERELESFKEQLVEACGVIEANAPTIGRQRCRNICT